MIIERTFAIDYHEDFGSYGLRPTWIPGFEPREGLAAVHDMMEHAESDNGSIEDELRATGTFYLMRIESGVNAHRFPRIVISPAIGLGGDIAFMSRYFLGFHEVEGREFTLHAPSPRVAPENAMEADAWKFFLQVAAEGARQTWIEHEEEENAGILEMLEIYTSKEAQERMAEWMLLGYRQAKIRYADVDAFTLYDTVFYPLAEQLNERVLAYAEDEGENRLCRITIDTDNFSYTVEVGFGFDEKVECGNCSGSGEEDDEECGICEGSGEETFPGFEVVISA